MSFHARNLQHRQLIKQTEKGVILQPIPGRPKKYDPPRWELFIENAETHDVMRRVARGAVYRGLSIAQFARIAHRDDGNVVRSMLAKRPTAKTIAAFCVALELPAIARRAITDEMTDRDVAGVLQRVAATGALDASDTANASKADIGRAARAYVLAENRLDAQRDPLQAFLSVLDPTADVMTRLRARRGDYPERVFGCAEIIRQQVPAAAGFTNSDLYQLCSVLADYVPAHDSAPASPHTGPIAELAGVKDALGHEAEKHANGMPLPKYAKKE
jgi:hypothetical protein